MPTYQYRCTACTNELEIVQKFTDSPLTTCPECSGSLRKVFNAVGVVFKGSGFYRTDSRSDGKSGGSGTKSEAASGSSGESKSDSSKKADSSTSSSSSSDSGSAKSGSSTSSSSGTSSSGSKVSAGAA
ncbi:FmdB family zinc ribbon protein [Microlunatus parietis]|uniref:Putative FmdB family regulatory protein n=1 Tax=Microlunatus parietis TaxID=682979 RepID=A0A7Y9IBE1_9ACTN|nr:FmdB family zinc ribbon protein [Microlunatus parietis]NYE73597.1 putative FmdB family regulatory protein [Microlunatus parietis]